MSKKPPATNTTTATPHAADDIEPRIVEGQISPIKASDLINLGRAVATGIAEVLRAPTFEIPPDDGDLDAMRVDASTRARALVVANELLAAPDTGEMPELRVLANAYRLAARRRIGRMPDDVAALACARAVIAAQGSMPITPLAADLLTLAYAHVSRANCERAGTFLVG